MALAENSEKATTAQKNSLLFRPQLFGSILAPIIFNLETGRMGFTIVAADVAFVQYKKFYFGGIGVGLAFYIHEDYGPYYDQYWRTWRTGFHYDQDFKLYLKLTPVKYYLGRKLFNAKTYAEIALIFEGKNLEPGIALGITISLPFKKKVKY